MEDKLKEAATLYAPSGAVRGHLAVDPSGHLVQLRPGSSLKDGWRWATKADEEKAAAIEAARQKVEAEKAAAEAEQLRADAAKDEPITGGPLK